MYRSVSSPNIRSLMEGTSSIRGSLQRGGGGTASLKTDTLSTGGTSQRTDSQVCVTCMEGTSHTRVVGGGGTASLKVGTSQRTDSQVCLTCIGGTSHTRVVGGGGTASLKVGTSQRTDSQVCLTCIGGTSYIMRILL